MTESNTHLPEVAAASLPPVEFFVFVLSMISVVALALAPHRLGLF
jgi:hypothetical protein